MTDERARAFFDADARARSFFQAYIAPRTVSNFGRCAYCGGHCYGRVCQGHRDLLLLDANYSELRRTWAS